MFKQVIEYIKRAVNDRLFVHLGDVNQNNAVRITDGELRDIAEAVVKRQQDPSRALGITENVHITGAGQSDFRSMEDVKT